MKQIKRNPVWYIHGYGTALTWVRAKNKTDATMKNPALKDGVSKQAQTSRQEMR